MKIEEIKQSLCHWDKRHPDFPHEYVKHTGRMEAKKCNCYNCTSGKTKLAVAMLEMVECKTEDKKTKWSDSDKWVKGLKL